MGQGESQEMSCRANCRPCSSSDPTADTVKVDANALKASMGEGKENAAPYHPTAAEEAAEAAAAAEAQRQRAAQEAERKERQEQRRREQEAALAAAQEAERQRKAEAEALAQQQREAEAEAARKRAREREAREAQARAEHARVEELRRAQEAKVALEAARAQAQRDRADVEGFLQQNGYTAVNAKRSRMLRKTLPLHEAVQQNNPSMVQLLLEARAEPRMKSSANQTPQELAAKLNKAGSHAEVLKVLGSFTPSRK